MYDVVIRPVCKNDLSDLLALARSAGPGMTNFPPDETLLSKKIELSLESFSASVTEPGQEYYFFVFEDTAKRKVIGCCGIFAIAGGDHPFYSYKVAQENLVSTDVNINKTINVLYLLHDYHDTSEIATLFLNPEYRKNKNGELLSRSRFMFIKLFQERFAKKVIAEMRGVIDESGRSPFWDSLGQHFFDMDFVEADFLCAMGRKQFIGDVMPRLPIYVPLLTDQAQAVIGKVHDNTKPAVALLEKEGFRYEGYIDIFDAGPALEVHTDQIKTVKKSKLYTVAKIKNNLESVELKILSNTSIDFRSCRAEVCIEDDKIYLDSKAANLLNVSEEDTVLVAEFSFDSNNINTCNK